MALTVKQVALVTGASGVIGKAIARQIAEREGFEVVLGCRDETKARRAADDIRHRSGNPSVRYEIVDVARRASVQALAARWQGPLHVLVNNAATTPRRRQQTPEGLEVQFATNIMGYFWMIQQLLPTLRESAPARVVNVASYWAGGLDLSDMQFERRRYDNNCAYRQSKQADRMLTVAFAEQLHPLGVSVNACHPGDASSQLSNDLGFGGHETPDQAAATPAWLAVDPIGQRVTGKYFEHRRETACQFGRDRERVQALFAACQQFAGE
jgi:NAD(P)-dependent dehydrogenase (short-subunit alcohol dehydrogenase family)